MPYFSNLFGEKVIFLYFFSIFSNKSCFSLNFFSLFFETQFIKIPFGVNLISALSERNKSLYSALLVNIL